MGRTRHNRTRRRSRSTARRSARPQRRLASKPWIIGGLVVLALAGGVTAVLMEREESAAETAHRLASSDAARPQIKISIPTAQPPKMGAPAPDFAVTDLQGRVVQLSKLRGKVVVVNFWATWCGPCRMEIPGLVKLYDRYREKGLEIVGLSLDNAGPDVVKTFIKEHRIPYPVAMATSEVRRRYGHPRSIPTTYFIDRRGRIAKRQVGYMPENMLEKVIASLL